MEKQVFIIFLVGACFGIINSQRNTWENYKEQHGKYYNSVEDVHRKEIYLNNVRRIKQHNEETKRGLHSYTLGENQFADLTNDEFKQLLKKGLSTNEHSGRSNNIFKRNISIPIPDAIDWRDFGFVSPVTDQGQCGDARTFAAISVLEGQERNRLKSLQDLSLQELIECCAPNCTACNGGFIDSYFLCLKKIGGIATSAKYPSRTCQTCQLKQEDVVLHVTDEIAVPSGDEVALKASVATVGPVLTAIDASQFSFQLYSGGVYDEPACSTLLLDHAVAIIGYGSETPNDYWLVKNSWGPFWGEQGYIRMSRNKSNQCGIATQASFARVTS